MKWVYLFFTVTILTEITYSVTQQKKWYHHKDFIQNIVLGLLTTLVQNIAKLYLFFKLESLSLWEHPTSLNFLSWLILFILYDGLYYLMHRLEHKNKWLWSLSHVHHHSSEHYNLSTNLRGSFLQPLYSCLFIAPLFVLGFKAEHLVIIITASKLFTFIQHTKWIPRLGLIDDLFSTPSNHRVHHGCNPRYIDKNFGSVLMLWDHLFKTYQKEIEPVRYGIGRRTQDLNLQELISLEFSRLNIPKIMRKPILKLSSFLLLIFLLVEVV